MNNVKFWFASLKFQIISGWLVYNIYIYMKSSFAKTDKRHFFKKYIILHI